MAARANHFVGTRNTLHQVLIALQQSRSAVGRIYELAGVGIVRGTLTQHTGHVFAYVDVEQTASGVAGTVVEILDVPETLSLFDTYESAANEQRFVDVDRLEEQISALGFVFSWSTDAPRAVQDLQIYPSDMNVSFAI